jgi:hypothetical protein
MVKRAAYSFFGVMVMTALLAACTTPAPDTSQDVKPHFDSSSNAMMSKAIVQEANRQLGYFCSLQSSYFSSYRYYASSMLELQGFTEEMITEGSTVNFSVKLIEATDRNFLFRATADDMDGDGIQSVWEVEKDCKPREITPD